MYNNTITKISPYLKCVATLPCEMSSVFKATIEKKTYNNTFKKINDREQRVLLVQH